MTSQSAGSLGTTVIVAAPAVDLKIRQFQVVAAIAVANQAYPRSTAEALLKIVAVEGLAARGAEQVAERIGARHPILDRGVRHSFHERLICPAEPVQDDEIGRGSPSRTTTRLTAAHITAAGIRRQVGHRLGRRRRRIFPIACKQLCPPARSAPGQRRNLPPIRALSKQPFQTSCENSSLSPLCVKARPIAVTPTNSIGPPIVKRHLIGKSRRLDRQGHNNPPWGIAS